MLSYARFGCTNQLHTLVISALTTPTYVIMGSLHNSCSAERGKIAQYRSLVLHILRWDAGAGVRV